MRRRGETREHTYRMILLDPLREPGRETFVPAKCADMHAEKSFSKNEKKLSIENGVAARSFSKLKIYRARNWLWDNSKRGDLLSTQNSSFISLRRSGLPLRSSVSIYRSFSTLFPFLFFLFFSLYLFLFAFLAAPLPYKLISRLPRTDGAEQLNSLFPFTYPFVSTFTFIFE